MNIYWAEQRSCDVPEDDPWLSAAEAAHLSGLRIAKRRSDWRLGRWTAKSVIAAYLGESPKHFADIELRPTRSGAPQVFIAGEPAAVTVSLSHREGRAICAVTSDIAAMGCDLELVEPRSEAFVTDYFTEAEQASIAGLRDAYRFQMITLLWSAKESALKALKLGLRLDTRLLQVAPSFVPEHHGWCWLRVDAGQQRAFDGWWRCSENFVQTVVADPAPAPPVELKLLAPSLHKVRVVTEQTAEVA